MAFDTFIISLDQTIREALVKIELNNSNIIFVHRDSRIVGCATDGDLRRAILAENNLELPISACMNASFVFLKDINYTYENVLKLLDSHIRVIPVLDRDGCLVDIASLQNLQQKMCLPQVSKAKSPVRVSFAGGGTDLTHFFFENDGVVLNAALNKYAHAVLTKRCDSKIVITSLDVNQSETIMSMNELVYNGNLDLIKSIIKLLAPSFGFELTTWSDVSVGSGLGGSAALLSAVIGAFNYFLNRPNDPYEIAELAFRAERIELSLSGGWQDQYATVFGGFNFMEFSQKENVVHPLRIPQETVWELEDSLLLCNTGQLHHSGNIHDDQKIRMQEEDVRRYALLSKDLAYEMKAKLLKNRLIEFGDLLNEAWKIKKQFSSAISCTYLDDIYDLAIESGARGGKLLGAGGGGYFLFFVPHESQRAVRSALEARGLRIETFLFDLQGLRTWAI